MLILDKKRLNPTNIEIRIEAPAIAAKAKPGQFLLLKLDEKGERIPLTIADSDKISVTIVFQPVGRTTDALSTLRPGDDIPDVFGPLGTPSEIGGNTVVMVGGGLGIAPCYPIAKALHESGSKVNCIFGARSRDLFFWQEKFEKVSEQIIYCTDDGSLGVKGFVTDGLRTLLSGTRVDRIFAIGPQVMMRNVTKEAGDIPVTVSLNPIMVDGMGMCGGCRVNVAGKVKFACVDGPEFIGQDVDWDSLMARSRFYKEEEHRCRIGLR